ncbi:hypothetical protein D9M72_547370 [compost metagenome]
MQIIVDQTSVQNRTDFINAITKKKAAIKNRNFRFALFYEGSIQINYPSQNTPSDISFFVEGTVSKKNLAGQCYVLQSLCKKCITGFDGDIVLRDSSVMML